MKRRQFVNVSRVSDKDLVLLNPHKTSGTMLTLYEVNSSFEYLALTGSDQRSTFLIRLWIVVNVLGVLEILLVSPSINFFIVYKNMQYLKTATVYSFFAIAAFRIGAALLFDEPWLKNIVGVVQRLVNNSECSLHRCLGTGET